MEWIEPATQFINGVGFPIVACCAMFYLYYKTVNSLNSTLDRINHTLDTLVNSFEEHRDKIERG